MNTIQPPNMARLLLLENQHATLNEALHHLLAHHAGQALDICTTHLTLEGWALVREGLQQVGNLRLLLHPVALATIDDEPLENTQFTPTRDSSSTEHSQASQEEPLAQIEALIAFLQQSHVEVRLAEHAHLHARCFLFYADQDSARIAPQTAIVGSSNLTRGGLLTNAELNVVHRARLTHEDIALKRLRGLLEREERTLLLMLSGAAPARRPASYPLAPGAAHRLVCPPLGARHRRQTLPHRPPTSPQSTVLQHSTQAAWSAW